jgi:hypothetical protein
LTDPNFRICSKADELHLMNRHGHWHGQHEYTQDEAMQWSLFGSTGASSTDALQATHRDVTP